MIVFLDGPAAGVKLSLQRAPIFLRVVIAPGGKVDALDQLDDEPDPKEVIHVYRVKRWLGNAVVCSRGKGCRNEPTAEYVLHDMQPSDAEARDTGRWQAWCQAQPKVEISE